MPSRILVVNVHSAQNAGDLALLKLTIAELRHYYPDAQYIISANYPDEPAVKAAGNLVIASPWRLAGGGTNLKPRYLLLNLIYGWILALWNKFHLGTNRRSGWNRLFQAYQEADMVVAVSGNQFFSSGRFGWPLFAIAMSIDLATFFNKPVYIMPQSVGPFRYRWEYQLLRKCYSKAQLIYLRDFQSIKISEEAKLPLEKVKFAPDLAFALKPAEISTATMILDKFGYKPGIAAIGATVIASMPSYLSHSVIDDYYTTVAQSLSSMVEKYDCHLFFFHQVVGPSSHEDDRIATEEVVNQITAAKDHIHVITDILSPEELKACYGCMDIFLASRLHSGIFSWAMGVPTVFIGYLTKTKGVLESLQLQKNMHELGNFSNEDLFMLLERTWRERDMQKVEAHQKMAEVIAEINQVATSIADDYKCHYG